MKPKIAPKMLRYWRRWNAAFGVHWAGVSAGEVLARTGRPEHHETRDQVIQAARLLAAKSATGLLTADVLRHACHQVALGRTASSKSLRAGEMDRVIAIFDLLAGEREVAARMAVDKPKGTSDRTRMMWVIDQVDLDPAYKHAIARDKFGNSDWRVLDEARLRQFMITLKSRSSIRKLKEAA